MKLLLTVTLFLTLLLSCGLTGLAQDNPSHSATGSSSSTPAPADTRIPRNSRIYIAPMDGFGSYLAAAFRKKGVPLVIVADREQADFEITGTHETKKAGWAKTIFLGDARSSASASIQIVN